MAFLCAQDKTQCSSQGHTRPYKTCTLQIPAHPFNLTPKDNLRTIIPATPPLLLFITPLKLSFCHRPLHKLFLPGGIPFPSCLHFWLLLGSVVSAECHPLRLFWPSMWSSSRFLWHYPAVFCFVSLMSWHYSLASSCMWSLSVSRPWEAAPRERRTSAVYPSLQAKLLQHRGVLTMHLLRWIGRDEQVRSMHENPRSEHCRVLVVFTECGCLCWLEDYPRA